MMMRRTVVSALSTLLATASLTLSAYAQQSSTAFTYQGFLRLNNRPVNGTYDFRFSLFNAATGGTRIAQTFAESIEVTDGLFTAQIDFGLNPFAQGQNLWMEIAVKQEDQQTYTALRPRIQLTAVPYALFSQRAQEAQTAQNAVNAQNATNAQNAQNATNAQNAQNATNAQNAQNATNAQNAQNATNALNANTANSANALRGYPVSSTAPQQEQILRWVNGQWTPSNELWYIVDGGGQPWLRPRLDNLLLGFNNYGRSVRVMGTSLRIIALEDTDSDYPSQLYLEDWPTRWIGLATWDICARNIRYSTLSGRSDMRLKQNIASLDPLRDSERLLSLRPVSYEWKPEAGTPGTHYGFIAQEVREIFPELVDVGVDPEGKETLGVRYLELIPHLVNVLQKQQAEINELRAEIQRLRSSNAVTER